MNRAIWFYLPTSHHAAGYHRNVLMAVEEKEDRRHAQLCNHFQDSLIYVCWHSKGGHIAKPRMRIENSEKQHGKEHG